MLPNDKSNTLIRGARVLIIDKLKIGWIVTVALTP